jgi:acyl-coenzyme A thioesterase PaaI-like protein
MIEEGDVSAETEDAEALQDRYAPDSICFGCGPANEEGLRIKSFPEGDEVVAEWTAAPNHQAFPGVLNGGIIGTLLDCHCNWTAAHHLMQRRGVGQPPVTVTAEYTIRLKRPTPSDRPVRLSARVVESTDDSAIVEAQMTCDGETTATCRGVFIPVREGHPAYDSW